MLNFPVMSVKLHRTDETSAFKSRISACNDCKPDFERAPTIGSHCSRHGREVVEAFHIQKCRETNISYKSLSLTKKEMLF